MAQTKFSIASQALILINETPVNDFDEGSNAAKILTELYDTWAENILSIHPWSFNTTRQQLIQENKTIAGWQYLYKIPSSVLRVHAVFADNSVFTQPVRAFRIVGDNESQYVATNEPKCFVENSFYCDESIWPAWFVEFAKYDLAGTLAMPIGNDADLASSYMSLAKQKFYKAISVSDQQSPPQMYLENEIIAARFS